MRVGLLSGVFMGGAQRKLFEAGVPIFTYHYIGDAPREAHDPFLYVPTAQFTAQIKELRAAKHSLVSLTAALDPKALSARPAVITFDDGCENVFRNALEPLAAAGATAIQFLVAGLIGGRNEWMIRHGDVAERLMDKSQILEWLAAGQEIGSHTTTHPQLPKLTLAAAREEISGSKKRLEDLFGQPIRHFCYPGGKWNEALVELVTEAGYDTACTTDFGVNARATCPLALQRIVPLTRRELYGKIVHRLRRKVGHLVGK